MQGIRKAVGVLLIFFGMVSIPHLIISLSLLMGSYAELEQVFGIAEFIDFAIMPLGVIFTEFILGFELCGFLTKQKVLEKPKPMDKGTKILVYGLAFAIFLGIAIVYFIFAR